MTAVATFSDSSTATATSAVGAGNATDDTFFGFVAPAGKSISNVTITMTGSTDNLCLDDLAFTTVPEPATVGLLSLGGAALIRRRRR